MKKKITFDKIITKDHFHVTIFGSARIKKGDKRYKMVYNLARNIGENGLDVVTGGGPGIMEAASQGHKEGIKKSGLGNHTIGLGIKLPHEQEYNNAINISKTFDKFSNRLDNF